RSSDLAVDGSAQSTSVSDVPTSTGQASEPSQPQGSDSAANGLPKNGAPAVENPLDASMLKDDACAAMTDEQAKQLPGNFQDTRMSGNDCSWGYRDDMFRIGGIGGSLDLDHPGGLSDYYGSSDNDLGKTIPVDTVHGYSAIQYDIGQSESGSCVIKIGMRGDIVYTAQAVLTSDHRSYDAPCEVTREFAEIVVENLKE